MGCNTSKETAPVDAENGQEDQNVNNKDAKAKPESAKTITLTSNGAIHSEGPDNSAENPQSDEAEAATRIQAAFRGHQTRKSMKQPGKQEEVDPTPEQLQEEFRADDTDLCNAAVKIQASFRGHMIRKQMEKGDETKLEEKKNEEEELDIDLSDPDLNKAAVKIQASFRGHMVRKEEDEKK